jgi:ATP-binding cassette subfamily B protein
MIKKTLYTLLGTIVISKVISTSSPYVFKRNIQEKEKTPLLFGSFGIYFGMRYLSSLLNEYRNVLVHRASYKQTNDYSLNTLSKYNSVISPPVMLKKFERARKGYKSLFTIRFTHIIPTSIDLFLSSILLYQQMGTSFSLLMLGTVSTYVYRSITITNNRLKERQQLNKLENAMSQNIDTFLRQKTVVDKSIFENISKKEEELILSLKDLNTQQQLIIGGGSIAMTYLWFIDPLLDISTFVMMHLLTSQIFQPLNQVGMIYREWKQSNQDIKDVNVV